MPESKVKINFECTGLDENIEKANRLVKLLKEAEQIINSLSGINDKSQRQHKEVEAMKTKLMVEHYKAIKDNKYDVAKRLLQTLINGKVKLGLDDIDWEVEKILERCGLRLVHTSKWGTAEYKLI